MQPKLSESTYSILSRIHIQSGESSPLDTLKKITGIRGYKPLSGLPTHIYKIANYLNYSNAEKWLYSYTHLPLYSKFVPDKRRQFLIDAMLYEGAAKSRLGLLKSHCGAKEQLAFCPECMKSDLERNGFPYWHREHMVQGVNVCFLHQCVLSNAQDDGNSLVGRQLKLPRIGSPFISIGEMDKLQFIANQVTELLNSMVNVHIDRNAYQEILKEQGFLTSDCHVRIKELNHYVKKWLLPIKEIEPYDKLFKALNVDRNWVANLVAGKDSFHHPLKHIILWGTLGLSFKDILNVATEKMYQMALSLEFNLPSNLSPVEIHEAISSCGSISMAAKKLNCCTSTLICYADKYGIPINRKAKYITYKIKKSVWEALCKGESSKEISESFGLSVTSVNRIKRSWRYTDII